MELPSQFSKSILLALAITACSIGIWGLYWRKSGYTLSYNDNSAAWAHQRAKVDGGNQKKFVMIGSSRIQFDMDSTQFKSGNCTAANPLVVDSDYLDYNGSHVNSFTTNRRFIYRLSVLVSKDPFVNFRKMLLGYVK